MYSTAHHPEVSQAYRLKNENIHHLNINIMKKVIIEITEKGWSITVHKNEKKFIEKHVATPTGAKSIEGNFGNEYEISEELYEALSGFGNYDIMCALANEC